MGEQKQRRTRTPLEPPRGPAKKKKNGRPSKRGIPLDVEETFIRAIQLGLTQRGACEVIGVSEATVIKWRKIDPGFAQRVAKARGESVVGLAEKAWRLTSAESEHVRLNAIKWLLPIMEPGYREQKQVNIGIVEDDGNMAIYTYV